MSAPSESALWPKVGRLWFMSGWACSNVPRIVTDMDRWAMTHAECKPWIGDVAAEVITASSAGRRVQPFSSRYADFSFAEAYEVAQRVHDIRLANGEAVIGRKIGFTNRAVWDSHGLAAPIWGYMYDSTVRHLFPLNAQFPLAGLAEPRIEPEIVLRLAHSPHSRHERGCSAGVYRLGCARL